MTGLGLGAPADTVADSSADVVVDRCARVPT